MSGMSGMGGRSCGFGLVSMCSHTLRRDTFRSFRDMDSKGIMQVHKSGPLFGKLACLALVADVLVAALLRWLFPESSIEAAAEYPVPSTAGDPP